MLISWQNGDDTVFSAFSLNCHFKKKPKKNQKQVGLSVKVRKQTGLQLRKAPSVYCQAYITSVHELICCGCVVDQPYVYYRASDQVQFHGKSVVHMARVTWTIPTSDDHCSVRDHLHNKKSTSFLTGTRQYKIFELIHIAKLYHMPTKVQPKLCKLSVLSQRHPQ